MGAPVSEILTSKILKIPKMLMFRPKKINVAELILLKYVMHVIRAGGQSIELESTQVDKVGRLTSTRPTRLGVD